MKNSRIIYTLRRGQKKLVHLAEGHILLAPELVVPVLRLLPQVPKSFLQLRFVLGDAVDDRTHVGERVWWPDPVMSGAGWRSDGRSLHQEHMKQHDHQIIILIDANIMGVLL